MRQQRDVKLTVAQIKARIEAALAELGEAAEVYGDIEILEEAEIYGNDEPSGYDEAHERQD